MNHWCKPRSIYPEVRVVLEQGWTNELASAAVMDVAVAEPLVVQFAEGETQAFIEIIEQESAKLVTVIIHRVCARADGEWAEGILKSAGKRAG